MSGSFEDRQARIDALIEENDVDRIPVQKRLLRLAKIGIEKPEALTSEEACRPLSSNGDNRIIQLAGFIITPAQTICC